MLSSPFPSSVALWDRSGLFQFAGTGLCLPPGAGGSKKGLCEGSQWSPELLQSWSEGARLSLWEPKGVEIKGAGESITIHIWFIHMFGYLKVFNGNPFYISYAH